MCRFERNIYVVESRLIQPWFNPSIVLIRKYETYVWLSSWIEPDSLDWVMIWIVLEFLSNQIYAWNKHKDIFYDKYPTTRNTHSNQTDRMLTHGSQPLPTLILIVPHFSDIFLLIPSINLKDRFLFEVCTSWITHSIRFKM